MASQVPHHGMVIYGSHTGNQLQHQPSIDDFKLLTLLGTGGYGKVYLARKTGPGADHNHIYAIKSLKKATVLAKVKGAEQTIGERKILEAVRECPFLVTLHYAFQTDAKLYLVLDYLGGGELFTHLITKGRFSVDETTFYISELSVALAALHDLGIIYRDLKLENILLDNNGHIVLTDFGLSRKFEHVDRELRAHSFCGTIEYMAPEVVDKTLGGYDFTADWWSLGVLTYELLTGRSPFNKHGEDAPHAVKRRILACRFSKLDPNEFPITTRDFIERLLVQDPTKRLGHNGYDEIRSHAFFFKINWADLVNLKIKPPIIPELQSEDDPVYFPKELINQLPSVDATGDVKITKIPKAFREFFYVAPNHVDETGAEINPLTASKRTSSDSSEETGIIDGPTERLKLLQTFRGSPFFNKYQIDFESPLLGRGSFSTVRRCIRLDSKDEFAVKILNRHARVDYEIVTLTASQGHGGVMKLVDVMHDKHNSYLVCELLTGRDLLSHIQKKHQYRESEARQVFRQLVEAVNHMHEKGVVHLDLKPENILFESTEPGSSCKIVDFGFARLIKDLLEIQADSYTLPYVPPEVLIDHCYTVECDMWSLGVVLYVMLSGHVPFNADCPEKMAELVAQCKVDLDHAEWKYVSSAAKDVIRHLLIVDPHQRMTLAELMEHQWMTMEGLENDLGASAAVLRDNSKKTGGRIHNAFSAFFKSKTKPKTDSGSIHRVASEAVQNVHPQKVEHITSTPNLKQFGTNSH